MSKLREWMRKEIAVALAPQLRDVNLEVQRSMKESERTIERGLREELALARTELSGWRHDHEGVSQSIAVTLERMAADLEASRAAVRSLVARTSELLDARPDRASAVVLGGTISPSAAAIEPAAEDARSVDIDLTALEVGVQVEARSRFSDAWRDGYVVVDVVAAEREDGTYRYRLASEHSGRTLPMLFAAGDVRRTHRAEHVALPVAQCDEVSAS